MIDLDELERQLTDTHDEQAPQRTLLALITELRSLRAEQRNPTHDAITIRTLQLAIATQNETTENLRTDLMRANDELRSLRALRDQCVDLLSCSSWVSFEFNGVTEVRVSSPRWRRFTSSIDTFAAATLPPEEET